jgi:YYY domain-containing protein
MVAMLIRVSGVASGVGFNLALSSWFGLISLGSYGLVYSLLETWKHKQAEIKHFKSEFSALLAPMFILIVSNIEGFLEMLHSGGLFWKTNPDGSITSNFWSWLNILELNAPPTMPYTWMPERVSGIWWWRASRVLGDFNLIGDRREVIDEFPFFSFYLGDLHPHVLTIPFVLLALGLAMNFFFRSQQHETNMDEQGLIPWLLRWFIGDKPTLNELGIFPLIQHESFWLVCLVMGGLAFLNTWDFPIYVALFAAAFVLGNLRTRGWQLRRIWEFIEAGFIIGVSGVLLYIPFYVGFASQAGGFLPSLSYFTRGVQLWVMFAPMFIPIFALLFYIWRKNKETISLKPGLIFSSLVIGGLWIASYIFGALMVLAPALSQTFPDAAARLNNMAGVVIGQHGTANLQHLLGTTTINRLVQSGAWITLFILLTLVWSLLNASQKKYSSETTPGHSAGIGPSQQFALLMLFVAVGLVIVPEFIYLRDQFGYRMNTIFKFYYQAWILFGLAAAYASVVIFSSAKKIWGGVFRTVWVITILMSLVYPLYGIWVTIKPVKLADLSLDGTAFLDRYNPDDAAAIDWLQDQEFGIIAEASRPGASYTGYSRIATQTGLPTVLGWPGHESQWRGGSTEMAGRQEDLELLYRTPNWIEAESILKKYDIRYIVVGNLENSSYPVNAIKFDSHLKRSFEQGSVVVYVVPDYNALEDLEN